MTKTSCRFASQLSADLSMLFLNHIRNAKKECFPLLGLLYYFERFTIFVVVFIDFSIVHRNCIFTRLLVVKVTPKTWSQK